MGLIEALAVVIGIMGGLATGVYLQIGSIYLVIWVTFVAWASFYAAGGGNAGFAKSTAANIWGAVIATISLWIFGKLAGNGMNVPLAAALCVGVAIVVLIMGAKVDALGFIPGQVFGYAPTAGLFVTGFAAANGTGKMLAAAIISLVLGNVLGIISEKAAGAVAKS